MGSRGYFSGGINEANFYLAAVGANKVPGVTNFNMNARKSALVNGTKTPIVEFGSAYVFPDNAGEAMTLVSTSASDIGSVVEVQGLDVNFKERKQFVVLNGTTPVDIGIWTRINACSTVVKEVVGTVTLAGPVNTFAVIDIELQRSSLGVFSTPTGTRMTVLDIIPTIIKTVGGGASTVDGHLKFRASYPQIGAFSAPFTFGLRTDGTSLSEIVNPVPVWADSAVDLLFEAEATANDTSLYVRASILMEEIK